MLELVIFPPRVDNTGKITLLDTTPSPLLVLGYCGEHRLILSRTISRLHRLQVLSGVDTLVELCRPKSVDNYFTIILQSSVGTLEGHSEGIAVFDQVIPN